MDEIKIENLTSSDSENDLTEPIFSVDRSPIASLKPTSVRKRHVSPSSSSKENRQDSASYMQEKKVAYDMGHQQKPVSSHEPHRGNALKHFSSPQLVNVENDPPNTAFGSLTSSINNEDSKNHSVDNDTLNFPPNVLPCTSTSNPGIFPVEAKARQSCSYTSSKKSTASSVCNNLKEKVTLLMSKKFEPRETNVSLNSPITKEELAMNKSKVLELESWIKRALLSTKKSSILVLTGPTGSGKTTAVQAVAGSLNLRVIEWITPMDEFHDVNIRRFPKSNQCAQFLDFLLAGSRYQPVIGPSNADKIIIVEDYPNAFLRTPTTFHDVVMKFAEKGKCPLIFITTDGRQKISLDLFPEKLIRALSIEVISFNSVAITFMKKAIDRFARVDKREYISEHERKAICVAANGDLRSAENIWNFQYAGTPRIPHVKISYPGGKKPRGRPKGRGVSKKQGLPKFESTDPAYEKLHCVGRVLYAKREKTPVESGSRDTDPRGYLRTDPNVIADQFLCERHSFVALAHENYLSLFSDVDSVAQAAENLSFSDIIRTSHLADTSNLDDPSFTIAIRGFMTSCTNPVIRWNPLRKSRLREVADKAELFRRSVFDQYAGSPYTVSTAILDMVPMIGNLEKHSKPFDKLDTGMVPSPTPHISDYSDEEFLSTL